jgi:heme-degrading monooxygenase HmoA
MFARCTTMQFRLAFMDKAIEIYKNSIVPDAQSQKGFQGLNFYLDRKTGKAVSTAIWDSEEDALANEKSLYYQEQLLKLRHYFANPPIREGYEVIVRV